MNIKWYNGMARFIFKRTLYLHRTAMQDHWKVEVIYIFNRENKYKRNIHEKTYNCEWYDKFQWMIDRSSEVITKNLLQNAGKKQYNLYITIKSET